MAGQVTSSGGYFIERTQDPSKHGTNEVLNRMVQYFGYITTERFVFDWLNGEVALLADGGLDKRQAQVVTNQVKWIRAWNEDNAEALLQVAQSEVDQRRKALEHGHSPENMILAERLGIELPAS